MAARNDDYEFSWNRDDKHDRGGDSEEPITSVAEANKPLNSPRSESPYSNDFENDAEPAKHEKTNTIVAEEVVEQEEPVRTQPARAKHETNDSASKPSNTNNSRNAKSNNGRSAEQRSQSSQMSSGDSRRPKTSMYDTRYGKFAPNHARELSETDLQEQSERLSAPRKYKTRNMPPVADGVKTYKGQGLKSAQVEEMLERLTQRTKPATDSRRTIPELITDKCGIMNSFQWNGRW